MSKNVSSKQVEMFTKRKISMLLSQSRENTKILAELMRGIGKVPGEVPQLWGYFLDSMPEEFYGDNEPSRAEWAVYTSLTLFALHQQGKDPLVNPVCWKCMFIWTGSRCYYSIRLFSRFGIYTCGT